MAESAPQGGKLNVFISYSRDDIAFADQLRVALQGFGFGVTIDRDDITGGDAWEKRLGDLIRDADTVVFVLSPSSARSTTCAWEVEQAVSGGKRILPALCRALDGADPPPQLAALNYIYFYPEPKVPGSGFGKGLVDLASALNTDANWLREHTRYLRLAKEWEEVGKLPDRRLLSAADIALAKTWMEHRPTKAPEITPLQLDFINASEAEDIRRQSAEAARLKEVLDATAETRRQLDRANQAIAESIVNCLDLKLGEDSFLYITPRQQSEFWNLAGAGPEVKSNFVSILAEDPTAIVRTSPAFAMIFRALGPLRPDADEAERLFAATLLALQTTIGPECAPLVDELGALAPKLTVAQTGRVLDPVAQQFGRDADAGAIRVQALVVAILAPRLTDGQVGQVLEPLLVQIAKINDASDEEALGQALRALASRLDDAQTGKAFDTLLRRIGGEDHSAARQSLVEAFQSLLPRLTEAQTNQALEHLSRQINSETYPPSQYTLIAALESLAPKLNDEQAGKAFEELMDRGSQGDLFQLALATLAETLDTLAGKLTKSQADQALSRLLTTISETTRPNGIQVLAEGLKALAPKLADIQAQQALNPLLKQLGVVIPQDALEALGGGLKAVAERLNEGQARLAATLLLKRMTPRDNGWRLRALAVGLSGLRTKLTQAQANRALDALLGRMQQTNLEFELLALAEGVKALSPPQLTEARANDALEPLLKRVREWNHAASGALAGLLDGLKTLPLQLSQEQADRVRDVLLQQIENETNPAGFPDLLSRLPPTLTETQADGVLDALLRQIGRETNFLSFHWLAQALEALAPKLNEAQALRASKAALSCLGWSYSGLAAEWAQALATLPVQAADRDSIMLTAIAYPSAGGEPTEILLDAIRARHPEVPGKEKGTEAALEWLAKTYPEVLRPPICPQPLQSGFKCPPREAAAAGP